MDFADALNALYQGKKIRRKAWSINISYQLKNGAFITLNTKDLLADDWETVEKEILLNQKEKEFLESVFRPYTGSYDITIEKKTGDENQYYLDIVLFPHMDSDSPVERFCLPLTGVNEELMFGNLEKDYQYTTDDLNLFCK